MHKNDWKKFETDNKTIALNILYVPYNSEEIRHPYISKHNSKRENQVIFLMIADNEKWYYLDVKKLSALFCKITSKHGGDFYYLNCLNTFSTKNKLKEHKNVCKNHDYCYIEMSKEESILKYNHQEKFMKTPFIICADMESLLEKIDTCHTNPEKSATININKHTVSDFSLFTHCSFDVTKKA